MMKTWNKLIACSLIGGCSAGFAHEADPTLTWGTSDKPVPLRLQPDAPKAYLWGTQKLPAAPLEQAHQSPNKTTQSWPTNKTEGSNAPLILPKVKGITLTESSSEWQKEAPKPRVSGLPPIQVRENRPAPTMESENERLRRLQTPNTWR